MNPDPQLDAVHWQIDEIHQTINIAEDIEGLRKARALVEILAPLYIALGYTGTLTSLKERVVERAEKIIRYEYDYLEHARKNDKHRESTLAHIRKLRDLAETMK